MAPTTRQQRCDGDWMLHISPLDPTPPRAHPRHKPFGPKHSFIRNLFAFQAAAGIWSMGRLLTQCDTTPNMGTRIAVVGVGLTLGSRRFVADQPDALAPGSPVCNFPPHPHTILHHSVPDFRTSLSRGWYKMTRAGHAAHHSCVFSWATLCPFTSISACGTVAEEGFEGDKPLLKWCLH